MTIGRTTCTSWTLLAAALAAAGTAGSLSLPLAEESRLQITMEARDTALYPGDDVVMRMIFVGKGEDAVTVDPEAFARQAFIIRDAEGRPPRQGSEVPTQPAEPLVIHGHDTQERLVNLSAWYPKLSARKVAWEVTWSHGAWKQGPLRIVVTRPYDADKDRIAVVETALGVMTWDLMPEYAPQHAKHFVDLSRQGFYDGLTIFRVIPGVQAEGGDPKGDGTGGWNRLLPPEISPKVPMGTGLVGALRQETSMTSDSIFFITLSSSEYMLGKQTFFARMVEGWEVIAKLHQVPNKGETGFRDAFLLEEPVKILRVRIK